MRRLAAGLIIALIALAALIGGLMAVAQTNWFAQLAAQQVSKSLQRQLDIAGPLQIDWSLHPRIHIPALTLANPDWADEHPMAHIVSAEVALDLPALLGGRLALTDLFLQEPYFVLARAQDGRRNWDGLTGRQGGGGAFHLTLDAVRIENGRLYYADATQALKMDLAVHTDAAAQAVEQLQVAGHGSRHGRPFELDLHGGPLLAITDKQQPYPVSGWLHAGQTALEGKGTLQQPLAILPFINPGSGDDKEDVCARLTAEAKKIEAR